MLKISVSQYRKLAAAVVEMDDRVAVFVDVLQLIRRYSEVSELLDAHVQDAQIIWKSCVQARAFLVYACVYRIEILCCAGIT